MQDDPLACSYMGELIVYEFVWKTPKVNKKNKKRTLWIFKTYYVDVNKTFVFRSESSFTLRQIDKLIHSFIKKFVNSNFLFDK